MSKIHATALVEEGAQLGENCIVHPYAVIGRHCVLGDGVVVHPFAVLGGPPQDLGADPSIESSLRIGARTTIREQVTIHRATTRGATTEIGTDCFIMATAHIAHDCRVGNRVVMANAVLLGGHVQVGDNTFIGGGAVVHQHCRIGEGAMIGGAARISEDVAPYCLAAERNVIAGLNVVGLRRRGIKRDAFGELKRVFQQVNHSTENPRAAARALLTNAAVTSDEARCFLQFYGEGTRRIARFGRNRPTTEESPSES